MCIRDRPHKTPTSQAPFEVHSHRNLREVIESWRIRKNYSAHRQICDDFEDISEVHKSLLGEFQYLKLSSNVEGLQRTVTTIEQTVRKNANDFCMPFTLYENALMNIWTRLHNPHELLREFIRSQDKFCIVNWVEMIIHECARMMSTNENGAAISHPKRPRKNIFAVHPKSPWRPVNVSGSDFIKGKRSDSRTLSVAGISLRMSYSHWSQLRIRLRCASEYFHLIASEWDALLTFREECYQSVESGTKIIQEWLERGNFRITPGWLENKEWASFSEFESVAMKVQKTKGVFVIKLEDKPQKKGNEDNRECRLLLLSIDTFQTLCIGNSCFEGYFPKKPNDFKGPAILCLIVVKSTNFCESCKYEKHNVRVRVLRTFTSHDAEDFGGGESMVKTSRDEAVLGKRSFEGSQWLPDLATKVEAVEDAPQKKHCLDRPEDACESSIAQHHELRSDRGKEPEIPGVDSGRPFDYFLKVENYDEKIEEDYGTTCFLSRRE
eukprot:TRINITY_DN10751_c0_g1_i2.p1 TRINITY_DN10751_c0_g1~~TRINITY_DN10751_c0_g1_i2.p1  ORF type:complete len:514 (+),score=37.35 TRINITY_DN10751_c0_g1_i2:63-1544(+)